MDERLEKLESVVERRIRAAQEAGEFDALPGAGKPISDLDRPYDPAWWARRFIEQERAVAQAVELAAEIDRQLPKVLSSDDESDVRARLGEFRDRQERANRLLPPDQQMAVIDVERIVADRRRRRPFR